MKRIFAAVLLAFALAVGAFAQDKHESKISNFIRCQAGNDGGLQIAVTDYTANVGTQTVTVALYGVVHIADGSYYKKVQKDLDSYDVVLYEGVGGDRQMMVEQKKTPSVLSTIQHLAGDFLNLDFQLDSIDYTRKNLVHADVGSMDELKDKMKGESISPLGNYVKEEDLGYLKPLLDAAGPLLKEVMKSQPEWQNKIKAQFAESLTGTDITTQMSPALYKAIVLDRDAIVIEVLKKQLKTNKKTFAVFYGAAHMPDLEARLELMGFKQKSKRWMTAWKIQPVVEDSDEESGPRIPERRAPSHQGKRLDGRQKNVDPEDDDWDK